MRRVIAVPVAVIVRRATVAPLALSRASEAFRVEVVGERRNEMKAHVHSAAARRDSFLSVLELVSEDAGRVEVQPAVFPVLDRVETDPPEHARLGNVPKDAVDRISR